jgi:very-short-patch-repair endonuclease
MTESNGERAMETWLIYLRQPYEKQYHFARHLIGNPTKGIRAALAKIGLKDWRFDFALPELKIAVEVEGGVFVNGGHNRGAYYTDNCRKYNAATLAGWRVFRFTTAMVTSGDAFLVIKAAINEHVTK